jgi:hypothetical protein
MLERLKDKFWLISFPVAVFVMLSLSALKEIEQAQSYLDYGKKTAYYLRTSTDSLTYYAIAYTSTKDQQFLDIFNSHLERRKTKTFQLNKDETVFYNAGLDYSNKLAKEIEEPAFKTLDPKPFFTKEYIEYKKKIYENIEDLHNEITDRATEELKKASLMLNIYIYTLALIIIALTLFIRMEKNPQIKKKVIKKVIKKKK